MPDNPLLEHYLAQQDHQKQHMTLLNGQPHDLCISCLVERDEEEPGPHDVRRRFSWAVPTIEALQTIEEVSPNGVVEIGAGSGYWTGMLRQRGVDVIAYDPDPPSMGESEWHTGFEWSPVEVGNHRVISDHADRTLLLVWPNYSRRWTDAVVELYQGDTVVYVGEGPGGCTGTRRMHELLGWQRDDDACVCSLFGECTCPEPTPSRFRVVDHVGIPQWMGYHDRLTVHQRITQ